MPTDPTTEPSSAPSALSPSPEESGGIARLWAKFRPLKLDGYILTEFIGPFLGGLVFFIFVMLMLQVLRLAEFFIVHGVALSVLLKMSALFGLSFMPMVLPVSFLIAVLISFGRLSSDSELVAMKANGLSIHRLSAPIVGMSVVVVIISMFLNMDWVPWGERELKKTIIRVGNTKVVSSVKEGTFTSGFFDLLIFADKVDSKTNRMSRVFIYDEREAKNPMTIVARSGEIVPVKPGGSGNGSAAMLKLFDGSIHRNDLLGNTYQKIDFGQYRLYLSIEEGADEAVMKPKMISYGNLLQKMRDFGPKTWEGREFRGEYWRRFAIAMSPLIFVFLGIGFGTVRTRAVRAGAALIALITLSVYWGVQTAATIGILRGFLDPLVAMQLPNLVVGIAAVFAYRKATW